MNPETILKQYFGYETFRKGQKEAIRSILSKKDVLGIMPTGSGKSICFQVPALLFSGVTLVISPLISLMQDQVANLKEVGIDAAYINSSLSERQIQSVYEKAKQKKYRLLYVAPERLLERGFLAFSQTIPISMVVVDEAHCISQWGQDFRPSYAKIPEFIATLPKRPIVTAFTATATTQVRDDILHLLELQSPTIVTTGFDRENLFLEVKYSRDKNNELLQFLAERENESGIIYCSTRDGVEKICSLLQQEKFFATRYHAGLSRRERSENQIDFLYDLKQIMVATNAFGMGIDKSNVSYVVHFNMPKDMESYYQEIGRAGRDGSPAHCLLLYNEMDATFCRRMIAFGKGMQYESEEMRLTLRRRAYKRLNQMVLYATGKHCLRHTILQYFGEESPETCDNCSVCNTTHQMMDITVESQKIISCVARGREQLTSEMVIDVLRGVESDSILQLELQDLSTFGISTQSSLHLSAMINHLVWKGFLAQSDEKKPILQLTKTSYQVVKSLVYLDMQVPIFPEPTKKETTKKKRNKTTSDKPELFESLRKIRMQYAKAQGVPPFVVFSDATLLDMCKKEPTTAVALLQVSGVGDVKLEKYGDGFLEAIRTYRETN